MYTRKQCMCLSAQCKMDLTAYALSLWYVYILCLKSISKSVKCVMCLVEEVITMHALSPSQSKHMYTPVVVGYGWSACLLTVVLATVTILLVYLHACSTTVTWSCNASKYGNVCIWVWYSNYNYTCLFVNLGSGSIYSLVFLFSMIILVTASYEFLVSNVLAK